jgi:hypothetical protein
MAPGLVPGRANCAAPTRRNPQLPAATANALVFPGKFADKFTIR